MNFDNTDLPISHPDSEYELRFYLLKHRINYAILENGSSIYNSSTQIKEYPNFEMCVYVHDSYHNKMILQIDILSYYYKFSKISIRLTEVRYNQEEYCFEQLNLKDPFDQILRDMKPELSEQEVHNLFQHIRQFREHIKFSS